MQPSPTLTQLSTYEYQFFENKLSQQTFNSFANLVVNKIDETEIIHILQTQPPKILDTTLRLFLTYDNFNVDKFSALIFDIAVDGSTRIMGLAEQILREKLTHPKPMEDFLQQNLERYFATQDEFLIRRILEVLLVCELNVLAKQVYRQLFNRQNLAFQELIQDYLILNPSSFPDAY